MGVRHLLRRSYCAVAICLDSISTSVVWGTISRSLPASRWRVALSLVLLDSGHWGRSFLFASYLLCKWFLTPILVLERPSRYNERSCSSRVYLMSYSGERFSCALWGPCYFSSNFSAANPELSWWAGFAKVLFVKRDLDGYRSLNFESNCAKILEAVVFDKRDYTHSVRAMARLSY